MNRANIDRYARIAQWASKRYTENGILLDNVLADIMADLDKDISSHAAMILSEESRFLSEQIRQLKGKQNV